VFHILFWGGLELCLEGLNPLKPPVATGLATQGPSTTSCLQSFGIFIMTQQSFFKQTIVS